MSLDKLTKQLRRDVAANPKKAAVLGLMVLVALYFWGPLVWKFVSVSNSKQSAKANMTSLILTDDPVEPSQRTKNRGSAKFRWEKVRQLIQQDPKMASAAFDPTWTNPFGKSAEVVVVNPMVEPVQDEAAMAAAVLAATQPEDLGLVLGSLLIGPRSRVATINGKSCREGDLIEVTDKRDKSTTFQIRVVEIGRHGVVVELGSRRMTLEMNRAAVARGDQIERHRPRGSN